MNWLERTRKIKEAVDDMAAAERRLEEAVREGYRMRLTGAEMARAAGMSRSAFYRRFPVPENRWD